MAPDWKPAPRIVDRAALARARLLYRVCAACGAPATNGHHVIPKGERGDDVEANIVGICGTGTMRCHGAWHGSPYVVDVPKAETIGLPLAVRRDREWVARRIGLYLLDERPDTIAYVLRKLGYEPGRSYLERVYLLTLPVN